MNVKHFIEDKVLLFEFTEELDHHEVEKLRKRTDYEIQRFMPRKVVFDFKKVSFMDSAGIGFVIGRYKTTNQYNGNLELFNVNNKVKRVFDISGVTKIVSIVDDIKSEQTG